MIEVFTKRRIQMILKLLFITFSAVLCIIAAISTNERVVAEEYEGEYVVEQEIVDGAINSSITLSDGRTLTYISGIKVNPTYSTNDMVEWILRKGNQLISILQTIAEPFIYIIFIISGFIALLGNLGATNLTAKGTIGMISSIFIYTLILYAPVVVQSLTVFIATN